MLHAQKTSNKSGGDLNKNLTSEPGGAVGFGRWCMDAEALAGQYVAVLRFLHQEAYLCQQAVQETRQHGCASNDHQVLREHFTGVNGALETNTDKMRGQVKALQTFFGHYILSWMKVLSLLQCLL